MIPNAKMRVALVEWALFGLVLVTCVVVLVCVFTRPAERFIQEDSVRAALRGIGPRFVDVDAHTDDDVVVARENFAQPRRCGSCA